MSAENVRRDDVRASVSSRPALPAGFQLTNTGNGRRYRIVKVLGCGGFGVTYEAVSPEGMRVAIKEFFPAGITARNAGYAITVIGDERIARQRLQGFFKEATVLSSLRDLPSVVEIYEIFYANQTAYYVMEYIDGVTMLEYLSRHGMMDPKVWNPQYRKLMQAIETLHNHGVIHRDISPDNIMVRNDGSFKLIDFGSARQFEGQQSLTISVKQYFAPLEQYSEHGQGRFTDVYSLAATIYYSFTGKLVPGGNDRNSTISQSLAGAGVSARQAEAICRALQVRTTDRYQTMEEFEEAYFGISRRIPDGDSDGTVHKNGFTARVRKSFGLLKEQPFFAAAAGTCFALALILQLLM